MNKIDLKKLFAIYLLEYCGSLYDLMEEDSSVEVASKLIKWGEDAGYAPIGASKLASTHLNADDYDNYNLINLVGYEFIDDEVMKSIAFEWTEDDFNLDETMDNLIPLIEFMEINEDLFTDTIEALVTAANDTVGTDWKDTYKYTGGC